MFLRAYVHASINRSECPCVQGYMFPRYLQYSLMDFRQIVVIGTSCNKDEPIRFWGQTVKGQGLVFTAQCTLVQMRGLGIACRLSVCLSVRDVGEL